ncbi:MAG: ribosome biogenesis GTPase Der [Bacilli bacterium]|nr:ribosome biogenesis GTPase Der [Bacilli bacterium]
MKLKTVALVGRPNVGKSTLFNKLAKSKISIIEDTPGVTRDRIYTEINYLDYKFNLIDTGGIDIGNGNFNNLIEIQVNIAIDEADVIVFVVDSKESITENDKYLANLLHKSNKRVIMAFNKTDNKESLIHKYDYYELGFSEFIEISAEHSKGITDLLDLIVLDFPKYSREEEDKRIKFSLIGRPNVGKSSLVNAILGSDKLIVSDVAGTTRDAVDTVFKYDGSDYVVIDTAGIRKRGKIYENIEKYSLLRSLKAIDRSDVCLLVIDYLDGIREHDKHIASIAIEKGKALVIIVNKYEEADNSKKNEFIKLIRSEFQFLPFVNIVFVSALKKKNIHLIMPEVLLAYENTTRHIQTSVLNDVINEAYNLNLPPSYKGKRLKIYYVQEEETKPPKFVFYVNNKNLVHFSYYRYLENKLRENIELTGTPIVLKFKNRSDK